jgi:MFS family permease
MDRSNGRIFALSYVLVYFAAPILYVGVIHAALNDRLGASATIANLPASAYLVAAFLPLILSSFIPYRLERAVLVVSYLVSAASLAAVSITLILPFSADARIAAVIGQALIQGFCGNAAQVYGYQCLRRGTTTQGRAKALKFTFTFTPISAAIGSLAAQFVLSGGLAFLTHPSEFALIYLVGAPCSLGVALLSHRYQLVEIKEVKHRSLLKKIAQGLRHYRANRTLRLIWISYLLWYFALNAMPNLSLYTRIAMGREPQDFSGFIMALRFGFKAVGGFFLGTLAVRRGVRSPVVAAVFLVGAAILWAWSVPGYFYLFAFGLLGAGELGGAYIPNYVVTLSSAAAATRNLAILALVSPVSALAPALHGALTDAFGFQASFLLAIATALIALLIVLRLPTTPSAGRRS